MSELPTGTVTFLLTDVEGSTALWQDAEAAMRVAAARHDALFEELVQEHDGVHIRPRGEGDSRFAVFSSAPDAVAAAVAIERAFAAEAWPTPSPISVRIGIHTGEAQLRDGDYYGSAVNRCARLRNLGHGGQTLLSEATVVLTRERLPSGASLIDLGQHRLRGLTEPERVFQVVVPDLPHDFPPLASPDARPNNLPGQPTAILGREREVADVCALLHGGARLVTLTGPGGTGKTRLSLQIAAELLDVFEHGVFFVELAPISDPALVPSTIAQTLGVRDSGGRPILDSLKEYLRSRSLLLVLDNFEQIVAAAPAVAELLAARPSLKMLVSSREPLHLRGEREYAVQPLQLPDAGHIPPPEALSQYAAVALFVERAVAVKVDFTVTQENAPAVAEICHRLDGLPLAIELAAARVRLLSPQAILARLERRLPLLTGGARDLPARQQTLRNAIAWSYDLLTPEEQALYRRLAVFVGGCTLEAAEAVCDPDATLGLDVLDGVTALAARSLVRQLDGPDDEPRFTMLETIREYGLERLEADPRAAATRKRFTAYFVELAERAEPMITGVEPGQASWVRVLEREHDNFRQILGWGPELGVDGITRLRLATALGWFWYIHTQLAEGRHRIEDALSTAGDAPPALRGHALLRLGQLAIQQGDFDGAERVLTASISALRGVDDRSGVAWATNILGFAYQIQGDLERAAKEHAEAIALFRGAGDAWGIGHAAFGLGVAKIRLGDYDGAEAALNESLSVRAGRHPGGAALTVRELGRLALRRGDLAGARARILESLSLFQEIGARSGIIGCLEGLALVGIDEGRMLRGARLLASASALREADGAPGRSDNRAEHDRRVDQAKAVLGAREFSAAWAAGQTMTLEQAVAYALEEPPDI